jgi:hypothetical protein
LKKGGRFLKCGKAEQRYSGNHNLLLAKKIADNIVQGGRDSDGNIISWVFTDIKERAYRWYGERSFDYGKTWKLEAAFFLERA